MKWRTRVLLNPMFAPDGGTGSGGGAAGGEGSAGSGATGTGAGSAGTPTGGAGTPAGAAAGGEGGANGGGVTQEQIDAIVQKRLARERKAWEQQLEEEKKKAAMTEAERLKAEKDEAENKAKQAQAVANQRLITAEAKVMAAQLGVKPERVDMALKLADLSGVEVNDNGTVDVAAVKTAVEAVITAMPELKGVAGQNVGSGSNPAGGGNVPKTLDEQIAEAEKNGNWSLAIALKGERFKQNT